MEYSDWLKERFDVGFYGKAMFTTPRQAHNFREILSKHGLKRIKVEKNADVHFKHDPLLHPMSREKAEEIIKKTAEEVDKNFKIVWMNENE